MQINVREFGTGPRVVLVHGSLTTSDATWERQYPLADRWTLVVPDRRGYEPNPMVERSDFEVDAGDVVELLGEGAHLVGHSYGAIVAACAAGFAPDAVRSLTLIEPPPAALMRGPLTELIIDHLRESATEDPEQYFRAHLRHLGVPQDKVPSPLPPEMERRVRILMVERPPWELELSEEIIDAPFPCLVISGGHSDDLERCSDGYAEFLGPNAQRLVLTGRGHVVQRLGQPVNDALEEFWRGVSS